MKYAIIDQENKVVNIIEYDGNSEYCPCQDHTMVEAQEDTMIGATYEDGCFTNPPQEPVVPTTVYTKTSIQKLVDVLVTKGVLSDDDKTEIQPSGETE